jgi:hypothetical protein
VVAYFPEIVPMSTPLLRAVDNLLDEPGKRLIILEIMGAKSHKLPRRRSQKRNPSQTLPPVVAAPLGSAATLVKRADIAHFLLLLAAVALSYLLPFELLVLSYAVLGPAHYLTEISWLHDRRYFLPHRGLALLLAVVAFGAMFIADPFWLGVTVSFSFVACAILATAPRPTRALAFLALAAGCFVLLCQLKLPFAIAWVLAPSVIHVSVFTLVFMIVGAHKAKSAAQFALVVAYLLGVAAILVFPPSQATVIPALAKLGEEYFGDIAPALGVVFGVPHLTFDARITGLLSFVYTYHYLNWFIKADVVRWAAVPRPRLAAIVALSLAATGLYFYNYTYGFMVLLLLSLTHVLLEFPLNSIAIRQLGARIGGGLGRLAKSASASG